MPSPRPLWTRPAPTWADGALGGIAAVAAVAALLLAPTAEIDPRLHEPTPWVAAVTAAGALGLAWRRRRPVLSFALVCAATVVVSATGHYVGLLSPLVGVGLLSLAVHCRRRRDAVAGLVLTMAALAVLALAGVPDLRPSDLGQNAVLFVAVWAVGDAVRSRRAYQAERVRAAESEAAAARLDAGRAATEERLRLAREMHDVVAHSMSLIAIQAGVGAHVLRSDPDAAARALEVVAETSRHALAQTRSLLSTLRDPGDDPRSPTPGLADLDALVDRVRQSGLAVDLAVAGEPRALDDAVGLAAYRIVQEALTNVLRHARAGRVRVGLTYAPEAVRIEVTDDGRPAAGPGAGGHGLAGLRERAQLLGGSCAAGPDPAGGFSVRAELPVAAR